MKCVAVLLGMAGAAALPGAAWAQIPTPEPAPSPALAPAPAPSSKQAPTAEVAPSTSATPPGGGLDAPLPAVAAPEAAAQAPTGDQYYVEPPGTGRSPAPAPPAFEPPVPSGLVEEPPPPPPPHHLAPRGALWAGARLGWFLPFGNLWANGVSAAAPDGHAYYVLEGKPWRDYASSGPMFEIDLGLRVSRSYTVFGLWERAQLGSGNDAAGLDGKQDGAESDFWAIGLRASSDPDRIGFLTEVAIGYRRARTFFKNGAEYQFAEAPFEARLGLGAEFRLNRMLSVSPLVTVGVGGFGRAERVAANGNLSQLTDSYDAGDGHAWATLTVGGHFDLLPSAK